MPGFSPDRIELHGGIHAVGVPLQVAGGLEQVEPLVMCGVLTKE